MEQLQVAWPSFRHVDRYGQHYGHFDQYGPLYMDRETKKVTTNVKTDKIYVLQLNPMRFEPLDIPYVFYLDI